VGDRIVQALSQAAQRVGKKLSEDASKAIQDMYKDAGSKTEDVIKRTAEADTVHAKKLISLANRLAKNDAKVAVTAEQKSAKLTVDNSLRRQIRNILGGEGEDFDHVAVVDASRFPESAQHIREAQSGRIWQGSRIIEDDEDAAKPMILTVAREGADENRSESLSGIATEPGKDRDEYPLAMFEEGGFGASVKHILSADNQAAGASIGKQLTGVPNGARVLIKVVQP
jgi:hypothetical protein